MLTLFKQSNSHFFRNTRSIWKPCCKLKSFQIPFIIVVEVWSKLSILIVVFYCWTWWNYISCHTSYQVVWSVLNISPLVCRTWRPFKKFESVIQLTVLQIWWDHQHLEIESWSLVKNEACSIKSSKRIIYDCPKVILVFSNFSFLESLRNIYVFIWYHCC